MVAAIIRRAVILILLTTCSAEAETEETSGCLCIGRVGNVNCDYADLVTMGDAALLIDHLFISGVRLPNLEEANIDGDPDGIIGIADLALLIDHLFINRPQLPLCPQPFNSPPETMIVSAASSLPFVNSVESGKPTTGLFLTWIGEDRVDHPYSSPEFKFEYRLFGPYTDSLYNLIRSSYMVTVFRTNRGDILRKGLPPDTLGCDTLFKDGFIDTIICRTLGTHYAVCDTSWDSGIRVITCDTVLIDTVRGRTDYGRVDTVFDIFAPSFQTNPAYNHVAVSSADGMGISTRQVSDTLYNLFWDTPFDTTVQMKFIFWVRARDPLDSTLFDPTPAFRVVEVIDPLFERDILITNWTPPAAENRALANRLPTFWNQAVTEWLLSRNLAADADFDITRDLIHVSSLDQGYQFLRQLLRYKVLIVFQDAAISGGWSTPGVIRQQVFVAIGSGVNAWVAARVPLGNHGLGSVPATEIAPADYAYIFGTEQSTFSGWGRGFFNIADGDGYGLPRLEDFVGAYPEDTTHWPEIAVDTARLRTHYNWQGSIDPPVFPFFPYLSEIGALPEVGWALPSADAEVIYRYRSLYGTMRPVLSEPTYEGFPVMHRLDRGEFRTVHANFTPLALNGGNAQDLVNAVLDWLYVPKTGKTDSQKGSGIAPSTTSTSLRRWYLDLRAGYADPVAAGRQENLPGGQAP